MLATGPPGSPYLFILENSLHSLPTLFTLEFAKGHKVLILEALSLSLQDLDKVQLMGRRTFKVETLAALANLENLFFFFQFEALAQNRCQMLKSLFHVTESRSYL